jgi:hypothetical protein
MNIKKTVGAKLTGGRKKKTDDKATKPASTASTAKTAASKSVQGSATNASSKVKPLPSMRILRLFKRSNLSFGLLALLLIGVCIGITTLGLWWRGQERQKAMIAAFNKDNLLLVTNSQLPSEFNFQHAGQEKNYDISLELTNNSEVAYQLGLTSAMPSQSISSPEEIELRIPEQSKLPVAITLPLTMPAGTDRVEETLEIVISLKGLSDPEQSYSLSYQIPLILKLVPTDSIVSIGAISQTQNLTYKRDSKPELKGMIAITNLSEQQVQGFYEFDLMTNNGELVQPLLVNELILQPAARIELPLVFKLDLPPANLLEVGEKEYLLKFRYTGELNGRKIALEEGSTQSFKIKVESL